MEKEARDIARPVLVSMPAVDYPTIARDRGIQGIVEVKVLVDAEGRVIKTVLAVSVPGLDEAAIDALQRARFKPGISKGRPVEAWVQMPVQFQLRANGSRG